MSPQSSSGGQPIDHNKRWCCVSPTQLWSEKQTDICIICTSMWRKQIRTPSSLAPGFHQVCSCQRKMCSPTLLLPKRLDFCLELTMITPNVTSLGNALPTSSHGAISCVTLSLKRMHSQQECVTNNQKHHDHTPMDVKRFWL